MRYALTVLPIFLGLVGCSSRSVTNTPRSAIEQMLLTGAVDRALEKFELKEIRDRKVFLDFSNLQAFDAAYIKTACRARFSRLGALLVEKPEDAEFVAEVASGAMGTEFKNATVGIPPLPVPNSPVPFPEAPLYKRTEQTGIVKLLIFVHSKGKFIAAHHYYAKADREEGFILSWRIRHRDDVRQGWEMADAKLKTKRAGGK